MRRSPGRFPRALALAAGILLVAPAAALAATTLDPAFAGTYSLADLGAPAGLPSGAGGIQLGGIGFDPANPGSVLLGATDGLSTATLWSVSVVRDVSGHVTGWAGPATRYASAPYQQGDLTWTPDGILFTLGPGTVDEFRRGSTAPDVSLSLANIGSQYQSKNLAIVPPWAPGAGQLKESDVVGHWIRIAHAPDGTGLYTISSPVVVTSLVVGALSEGAAWVTPGSPLFPAPTVLLSEYTTNAVAAYEVDPDGDITALPNRRVFLQGAIHSRGMSVDPVTGDVLVAMYQNVDTVLAIRGFAPPPKALGPPILLTHPTGGISPDPLAPGAVASNQLPATFTFEADPLSSTASFLCAVADGIDPAVTAALALGLPGTPCTSPFQWTAATPYFHTFVVWGIDAFGKRGPPATFTWFADFRPPLGPGFVYPPTSLWHQRSVAVDALFQSNVVDRDVVSFVCELLGPTGGVFQAVPCTWTMEWTAQLNGAYGFLDMRTLADGEPYVLRVSAVDAAGNVGSPTQYPFVADRTPPVVTPPQSATFLAGPSNTITTNELDPAFVGSFGAFYYSEATAVDPFVGQTGGGPWHVGDPAHSLPPRETGVDGCPNGALPGPSIDATFPGYAVSELGPPPGVPADLGGVAFAPGDPDRIYVLGSATSNPDATVYAVPVSRDPVTHRISGYAGPAVSVRLAEGAGAGPVFFPDGVLLTLITSGAWIVENVPGGAVIDALAYTAPLGLPSPPVSLAVVPSWAPGAGTLKLTDGAGGWAAVGVAQSGVRGTYDLVDATPIGSLSVGGAALAAAWVPPGSAGFPSATVLVAERTTHAVSAYDADANGDLSSPATSRRLFLRHVDTASGLAFDPLTGDLLVVTFDGSSTLLAVSGFQKPSNGVGATSWPAPPVVWGPASPLPPASSNRTLRDMTLAVGEHCLEFRFKDDGGNVGSGTALATVVPSVTTPVGPAIPPLALPDLRFPDGLGGFRPSPVTMGFPGGVTVAGLSGVNVTSNGPPLPPGATLLGSPPSYFDVLTTATFTPPATVCVALGALPAKAKLLHFDVATGRWVDVTGRPVPAGGPICAQVPTLSPFAVVSVAEAPPESKSSGCGCVAGGRAGEGTGTLAFLLLALLLYSRPRARSWSSSRAPAGATRGPRGGRRAKNRLSKRVGRTTAVSAGPLTSIT